MKIHKYLPKLPLGRLLIGIGMPAVIGMFSPMPEAATVQVNIENFAFSPNPVRIKAGDSVLWKNLDSTTHTSTSGVNGTADGKWDSGFLGRNGTFSHAFEAAGTFPYFCIPHASFMQGSVIVEAATVTPPTVSITDPANNATFSGPTNLTISANAEVTGSTVSSVEFFDGATSLGSDNSNPYSVSASFQAGTHSLTAKATAANGASATSPAVTITITTPAAAPTVAIISPTNNTTFAGATNVTIVADASVAGGEVEMIEFFDNGTFLDMVHGTPFSIVANLKVGSHSLTAKATAASGTMATSAPVNVTITAGGTKIENPYPPIVQGDTTIELQTILDGLISPLGLAAPDDGSNRLFVYDQVGLIYVLTNGTKLDVPLLDVRDRLVRLSAGYDERGLLGVATHPNFAQNKLIYTYTSEPSGDMADFMIMDPTGTNNHQSVIAEWKIDENNPNQVDPASRREIMRIDEPQSNHNGGTMHFGSDGMLYVSLGDGGNADDQGVGHSVGGNGQDLSKVLGKILRFDVNARTSPNGQYGVPNDNPFVGTDGLDEIYAYGFRNPYSWSFDRLTGELYMGDVGQNAIEELDRVFKGGNYGWPIKEGSFYFDPAGSDPGIITTVPVRDVPPDLVDPIADYDHDEGIAIVGGYMYHGTQLPNLIGRYITGDLGSFGAPTGRLFYLDRSEFRELRIGAEGRPLGNFVKGFGEDAQGELYVFASTNLGPSGTSGKMLKIVPLQNSLTVAIEATTNGAALSWTGGVGPFVVEKKSDLGTSLWMPVTATAERSVEISTTNRADFFRINDTAGMASTAFTAYLSAAAERPTTNNSTGTGTGTLTLEGNTLHFDIHYSGLTGPATLAHIHGPASAAEPAPVMINLAPYNGGGFSTNGTLSGSVTLTPAQKATILTGKTYVNIHTGANPGGEIRGQVAPMIFSAELNGAAERPSPVASTGNGRAILFLIGNQLTFNANYENLPSAATLAHIHGPGSADVAAPVMVNLAPFNGGAFSTGGVLGGSVTLTADQLAALVDGLTYINVHTTNHPGGEIRGQVLPHSTAVPFSASLSGAAERPTPLPDVTGTGTGLFALEGHTLHFNIRYAGLTGKAIAAHIHGPAKASEAAQVMINLAPFNGGEFGTNGTLAGSVELTSEQLATILEGRTYVNVHTDAHGGGEIRGQIIPSVINAVLLGASERPASVHTTARGSGVFLLAGDRLAVNETYSGLSAAAIAAHIHSAADTANAAPVAVNFASLNTEGFGTSGAFAGTVTLTADQLAALADRLSYMNVHTTTHQGGEIRGQLTR